MVFHPAEPVVERGQSSTSPRQLRKHMDVSSIAAYNQTAHPFEWKKQVVFQ